MRGKIACRNAGGSLCKYLMKITSTEKNAMKENNKKKPTCHRVTPRSVKIIRLCFGFSSANCIIPDFFREIFPIMIEEKEKTNLLMNFVGGDLRQ